MKRTAQIDHDRQVVLPVQVNGQQVWTKAGAASLSPEEKELLRSNLINHRHQALVEKMAESVLAKAADFSQMIFSKVAPAEIVEAHRIIADEGFTERANQAKKLISSWIDGTQFCVIQDGLTTVVKAKGQEIARMTAEIEAGLFVNAAVERQVRRWTNGVVG